MSDTRGRSCVAERSVVVFEEGLDQRATAYFRTELVASGDTVKWQTHRACKHESLSEM